MLLPHRKKDKRILVSRNTIAGSKALLKSVFIFFFPVCNISSRKAVKMPRSAIQLQSLSRYIWHFRAAQPHLPLCLSASPATQTFIFQRPVQNQTFPQLSFSPSSLPLEWTTPFSITAQRLSFHFSTLQDRKCMPDFCWNQRVHFTASVFKIFYAIVFKK